MKNPRTQTTVAAGMAVVFCTIGLACLFAGIFYDRTPKDRPAVEATR